MVSTVHEVLGEVFSEVDRSDIEQTLYVVKINNLYFIDC